MPKLYIIAGCNGAGKTTFIKSLMGVYKIDERVATTPINAAGLYYNTYYHQKQLRFIDLSENFVCFTLN